jgi:ABC-type glycerol-3-phosphate transport system permease component
MVSKIAWAKWLAIIFFLIPMLLILVFPFIVMVSTSFKTLQEVGQIPPTFIPREPTLQNYGSVQKLLSSFGQRFDGVVPLSKCCVLFDIQCRHLFV